MMHIAYLGLGANLGDRAANLRRALDLMPPDIVTEAVSPVYETKPVGVLDQPHFLNAACRVATNLSAVELLTHVKGIEREMGRTDVVRNGPRIIDIDILLYDELVVDSPALALPHPRMHERAFVLVPLADIAPDATHPALEVTVAKLLARLGVHDADVHRTAIEL